MIQEIQLREAAMIAGEAILEAVSAYDATEIKVSPDFENKMHKLIKVHLFKAQMKKVIAAVLTITLIGGSIMFIAHPEVAASIWGWITEKCDNFYHYYFSGETTADHSRYSPQWLPEGYSLLIRNETETETCYVYSNNNNEWIQFSCVSSQRIKELFIFSDAMICREITVNNIPGTYYHTTTSKATDGLTWTDKEKNLLFILSANLEYEILLKIAESVPIK